MTGLCNILFRAALPALVVFFSAGNLIAGPVDLEKNSIAIRKGFQENWIRRMPEKSDPAWYFLPPAGGSDRRLVIRDLPFVEKRDFLSLEKRPVKSFTVVTEFFIGAENFPPEKLQAYYSANIGENWEVYLNGRLLRSEVFIGPGGRIEKFRHLRDVLIPLSSHYFRPGKNILAVRVIGDPANIDMGFHRSRPFEISDFDFLQIKRSEKAALVLMFLYLFFGFYHILAYMRRRKEIYNLYYGIFSVLLFVYLFSRTHTVYAFIDDSTLLHRIEYISLFLLLPAAGAFLDHLISGALSRATRFFFYFYAFLAAVVSLPVSNVFAIDVLRIWQSSAIVPLCYQAFWCIGRAFFVYFRIVFRNAPTMFFPRRVFRALKKTLWESTAGNLIPGAVIVLACALFDILDSMFWSYEIVLTRYGFFIFMLGITLVLMNRFMISHSRLEEANRIARLEMNLATDVQLSLLPLAPEELEDWDIALSYMPKYGASGDCYDFYCSGRTLRGISLFDVSGHGIAAALIAMIIKPIASRLFSRMEGEPLDHIAEQINRSVSKELSRLDNYASALVIRFRESRVEYVNMGHPDLLLSKKGSGEVVPVGDEGGLFRGEPLGVNLSHVRPRVVEVTVDPGDTLLLFSDGVVEGSNAEGLRYGLDSLRKSLAAAGGESAKEILDVLIDDFVTFINLNAIQDDFTLIVARKK